MPAIPAEQAYLFRHALLRDAAYGLQMPDSRARLHELAFHIIEESSGGRAPEIRLVDPGDYRYRPHSTDAAALELKAHAESAPDDAGLRPLYFQYLHRAAEHAEVHYQNDAASRYWAEFAARADGLEQGEALRRAAVAALRAGRAHQAEEFAQRAVQLLADGPSRRHAAIALGSLATVYSKTGRAAQAEASHQKVLGLFRELGDRRGQGIALLNLAVAYRETGRSGLAEHTLQQSLAIHREIGDRQMEGNALGNLSNIYAASGRAALAEQANHDSMKIFEELEDRAGIGHTFNNLGILYADAGRLQLAIETYDRALAIRREVSDRHGEGITLCNIALTRLRMRQVERARAEWCLGVSILRDAFDAGALARKLESMRKECEQAGMPPLDEEEA